MRGNHGACGTPAPTLTLMKFIALSLATALASRVFPVPGAPYSSIPERWRIGSLEKRMGNCQRDGWCDADLHRLVECVLATPTLTFAGSRMVSISCCRTSFSPPTLSSPTPLGGWRSTPQSDGGVNPLRACTKSPQVRHKAEAEGHTPIILVLYKLKLIKRLRYRRQRLLCVQR